jgi:hypothetical protein
MLDEACEYRQRSPNDIDFLAARDGAAALFDAAGSTSCLAIAGLFLIKAPKHLGQVREAEVGRLFGT